MTALTEKAMLVTFNRSMWTARKYDRKASADVAAKHGNDQSRARVNKTLVAKEAINDLQHNGTEARLFHYANTLPWDNNGTRLLPAENYFTYTEKMREFSERDQQLVETFCANYQDYVTSSRAALGTLFEASDYPCADLIKRKFHMSVTVMPIPEVGDFRVDLNAKEVARIKRDMQRTMEARVADANRDMWNRLHDAVERMRDRLTAYSDGDTKRLHATVVDNLRELTTLLSALNFTNDPELETMRQRIEQDLCVHDIEALKVSPTVREETRDAAQDVLDKLADYIGS